jgi:hypothetical protein
MQEIKPSDQYTLIATTISAFLLPSLFLFYKQHYTHSVCNLLSGIGSLCYWSNPRSTMFHTLDIFTSRICTSVYFCTTFYYSYHTSIEHVISTVLLMIQVIYFYAKSSNEYFKGNDSWVIYHAGFHVGCFMAITFCYILLSTTNHASTTFCIFPSHVYLQ